MADDNTQKLSRFMAKVLRHQPQIIKIKLSLKGWTELKRFAERIKSVRDFANVSEKDILDVVKDNGKIFEIRQGYIRARDGHSLKYVTVGYELSEPPRVLFYVDSSDIEETILSRGIVPKAGSKFVKMTIDEEIKNRISPKNTCFRIFAGQMFEEGISFFIKNDDKNYFYTHFVPERYVRKVNS